MALLHNRIAMLGVGLLLYTLSSGVTAAAQTNNYILNGKQAL